jgi:hypothetical protein
LVVKKGENNFPLAESDMPQPLSPIAMLTTARPFLDILVSRARMPRRLPLLEASIAFNNRLETACLSSPCNPRIFQISAKFRPAIHLFIRKPAFEHSDHIGNDGRNIQRSSAHLT